MLTSTWLTWPNSNTGRDFACTCLDGLRLAAQKVCTTTALPGTTFFGTLPPWFFPKVPRETSGEDTARIANILKLVAEPYFKAELYGNHGFELWKGRVKWPSCGCDQG